VLKKRWPFTIIGGRRSARGLASEGGRDGSNPGNIPLFIKKKRKVLLRGRFFLKPLDQ